MRKVVCMCVLMEGYGDWLIGCWAIETRSGQNYDCPKDGSVDK